VAVKHKMANYIRNEKTRDTFYEKVKLENLSPTVDESALEVKELIEFIREFTTDLPEKCRMVFQLSRTEHLSNKEIASRLNISEKTVETHITTALNKLRKKMGRTSAWLFFLS
jgi:RNA polymerase sigma factor (sigma-70 family)